jgi:hypothetical protein
MLSRAQEARVREILGDAAPGTFPMYCLEHLAATAQIPAAHLADLAAFVRNLRASAACRAQYGGICVRAGTRRRGSWSLASRFRPIRKPAVFHDCPTR